MNSHIIVLYILKKNSYMALIFIGACCHLGYLILGSSIDTDGFLIEPFALIPIGYLFYLLGFIRIIYLKLF